MQAFLSYSLIQNDLYLISLLSRELLNVGVTSKGTIYSSDPSAELVTMTNYNIRTCDLFIGILTGDGSINQNAMVYQEWEIAIHFNKSRIFLIEDTVAIHPEFTEPYIIYNRYNPNQVLQQLRDFVQEKESAKRNKNNLALIVGGEALIELMTHLSKKELKPTG